MAVVSAGFLVVMPAADTVATAVYSRVGHGYKRERAKDGAFKPEYYALANGGRIAGTTSDVTVDRVTYPQVAEIATRLLAEQNYRYARTKEQAKLLLVLQWGSTIAPNGIAYQRDLQTAASAYAELTALLGPQGMGSFDQARGVGQFNFDGSPKPTGDSPPRGDGDVGAIERFESAMLRMFMNNEIRDKVNEHNARVLG